MIKRIALAAMAVMLIVSCERGTTGPEFDFPAEYLIYDGAHSAGNPNFFFLPPMVKDPGATGTVDPLADPVVKICEFDPTSGSCDGLFASFAMGSDGIRFDTDGGFYAVNWDTDGVLPVIPDVIYRVGVFSNDAPLAGVYRVRAISRGSTTNSVPVF